MAFPSDSLLGRLDAAIAWFRQRVPMTAEEASTLETTAKENAFWISGTDVLGVIAHVQKTLDTAIENGESFNAWQERTAGSFEEVQAGHAQTVYRNATQSAYNRGRKEQLSTRVMRRARPFWQFVAITDGRTTDLCSQLNGTILAADDPRWASLLPPRHHNCRSTIRALRPSEAEALGGPTGVPDVEFPKGWGAAPEGEELAANYPEDWRNALEAKR